MSPDPAAAPAPVLLDGGLSTALAELGCDLGHPLWTARLVLDDPETLVAAHLAFLRAGARVLITASYQLSRLGLARLGLPEAEADRALARATELARRAAERFRADDAGETDGSAHPVRIAASVGPYGAVLADGSEYTGRYPIGHHDLVAFHAERLGVLVGSAPDLLACETLPGAFEARALAAAVAEVGGAPLPAWASFTCASGSHTANGDRIEDAAEAALAIPGLVAVGVNCTPPAHVAELLRRIVAVTDLPLVAYPNGGQVWDATAKRWQGDPVAPSADLAGWLAAGVRYVGGCCGVGPAGIATLAAQLADQGAGR